LTTFIQRQLRKNGFEKHPFSDFGTEEYLFNRYRWMREEWATHKIRKAPFIPYPKDLRRRWWEGRDMTFS
jgi:hypothetical protein